MREPGKGPDDRLFRFGQFVADPVAGVLRHADIAVPLTLKSFDVLIALIERRGSVVEKDELLRLVWPDTIVEENNLARHISTLRKVLNDQPPHYQFIVTIPGRGYRFAAGVEHVTRSEVDRARTEVPSGAASEAVRLNSTDRSPEIEPAADERNSNFRPAALVSAGVAALMIVAAVLVETFRNAEREEPTRKLWQLSSGGGLEGEPAWSPAGDAIAYSSDREGNFDIWVQPLGDGQLVRLTSSPAQEWQPSWSHDGRRIAFRSEAEGGGLFTISAAGGQERRITNFGYRPQWSRAGSILFYGTAVGRSPRLYVLDADGQPRQVLRSFLGEFAAYRAAWHPDSKRISIFGAHRQEGFSFWTVSLDGRSVVRSAITADVEARFDKTGVQLTEFTWGPDGDALYFEGRAGDAVNIWRIGVDPQSLLWRDGPERLTTGSGLDTAIAVSPDGRKLAFAARSERTRLWSFAFEPIEGRILSDGEPLNGRGGDAVYPDVTADGLEVVYRVTRLGRQELRRRSLASGEDAVVTARGELRAPRWSNDGTMLAFGRADSTRPDGSRLNSAIVLVSANGDNERLLTTPTTREFTPFDWSADGKWILGSCQGTHGGRVSICLLPLAGAPRAQDQMHVLASHPDSNLYQATFSPNHRWISFIASVPADGLSTVYTMASSGGQWTAVTEGNFWDDKPRWSPDGRTMYFVSNRSGFLNVWGRRYDPETGKPFGDAFQVTRFDTPSQRVSLPINTMDLALGPSHLILPVAETSGAVWILENLDQ